MGTHRFHCVVCRRETLCTSASYALGCSGGCDSTEPRIAFCSLDCFEELARRMRERTAIALELADWEDAEVPVSWKPRLRSLLGGDHDAVLTSLLSPGFGEASRSPAKGDAD